MSGIFGSLSGPGLFNLPNYGYGDVSDKSRAGQMTPRMTRRGAILPLAEYDDGSASLALPEFINTPLESFRGLFRDAIERPGEITPDTARQAFDVAGAAMVGGLGAGLAGGMPKNAVGMSGGNLMAGRRAARDLDALGYYSGALEAAKSLPQAKGSPEQMMAMLSKGGAKKGEIEATGLDTLLSGKPSVTRDEIVQYLTDNRVGLKEVVRSHDPVEKNSVKWSNYSLDPDNPSYMETVLHLPPGYIAREHGFRSGHFDEPNIIGHMMTSMTNHKGKPVFTLDQIQSDWGQMLRDGEARNEARIASLREQIKNLESYGGLPRSQRNFLGLTGDIDNAKQRLAHYEQQVRRDEMANGKAWPSDLKAVDDVRNFIRAIESFETRERLKAELRTAEAAAPGHPLVNTTDQWVITTLRRALRQAAEADAEYIAVPHGDTVLSYNPGNEHGMRSFYGSRTSEGIVPKNLRKILGRLDRDAIPTRVESLQTPSGVFGYRTDTEYSFDPSQTGFSVFGLSPELRRRILSDGFPLFANAPTGAVIPLAIGSSYSDK